MKFNQNLDRPTGLQSIRRHSREDDAPPEPEPVTDAPDAKARKKALDDDFDSVLDEIDGVLEANAEEFVQGFVQRGGE